VGKYTKSEYDNRRRKDRMMNTLKQIGIALAIIIALVLILKGLEQTSKSAKSIANKGVVVK
jgi:flagellar biogenesis protein FliO